MAKYGPFFSYWSKDFQTDVYKVIKRCGEAGATCTELHSYLIEDWADSKLEDFRKYYEDTGVEVAYWCGYTPETNILSADPAVRRAAVDSVIHYVKFTSKMKARILDGTYIQPWNIYLDEGRTKEEALADGIGCIKQMAAAAEDLGVTLTMEILNRFEGALVNTMREAIDVLDAVGSPNLKITADTFHMNIEEDGIAETIKLGGDRIGQMHIGEANRRLPGNGSMINWDELFGALRDVGYDGMFIFEAFVLHGGTVARDVKLRHDLSGGATPGQMTEQLKESLSFVKNKFEK